MRNRTENQIKLVLLRHGATKANQEHRYLGRTDEALTEEGREELLENKKKNCYPGVDILFSGPMTRCLQTAELLYPELCPVTIPEWREIDFGAFEGKNYKELNGNPEYQAWIDSGGTLPFPGGESREAFLSRCVAGFDRMRKHLAAVTEKASDKPCTAGIIVHGGTIMALLSQYYGGEYFDYQVQNGSGYSGMLWMDAGAVRITEIRKIETIQH